MIYNYINSNNDNEIINESVYSGNITGWGNCTIYVRGSEGPIPHVHIDAKDGSKKACMCLFDSKFFSHGEPNKYTKLDKKALKDFDTIMSKQNKKKNITNWEKAVEEWETSNASSPWEHKDDYTSLVKPDYTKTKEERLDD